VLARVADSYHVYRKPGRLLSINGRVRADGTKRAIVRVLQDEEAKVNADSVEAIVARPYARVLMPDSSGCLTARRA
jgi:hypothetical protein